MFLNNCFERQNVITIYIIYCNLKTNKGKYILSYLHVFNNISLKGHGQDFGPIQFFTFHYLKSFKNKFLKIK